MTEYEFTVVVEKDEDGKFVASVPALRGCHTEGDTEAEARELIKDAIRLCVQDSLANGEYIPQDVGAARIKIAV